MLTPPLTLAQPERPGPCPAAQHGGHRLPHLPGGCRCLVDAAPTHRFIQALATIGWSLTEQGRLLGDRHGRQCSRILTQDTIERATARRVAHLYARLWDVPGPSPRAVALAARRGWMAADRVVVARLVAGIPCPHTAADWHQAARVLAGRGLPVTAIAARLHHSHQSVRAATATATATTASGRAAA